ALASLVYQGSHDFSGAATFSLTLSAGGISPKSREALNPVSIAQQDANLNAQLTALLNAVVLRTRHANPVLAGLIPQANNGHVGKIGGFTNDVNGYLHSHVLTPAQATAVLRPANILLLGLQVEYGC